MVSRDTLKIIEYSLFKTEKPMITDWKQVVSELGCHGLLSLVDYEKFEIPEDIRCDFEKFFILNTRNYMQHLFAVDKLNEILTPASSVILKGFSAARYYPEPFRRGVGDIDFIPVNIDFDKASGILKKNGYEPNEKLYRVNPRHKIFLKDGISFEMHSRFSKQLKESHKLFDEIIKSSPPVETDFDGIKIYTFPDEINGLILLRHIENHIQSGLGLRQIVDWACYADSALRDEQTYDKFIPLCKKTGLMKLAECVTLLCEKYLGLDHICLSETADEETADILMEEISDSGNFGREYDETQRRAVGFIRSGNVIKRIYLGALSRCGFASEHKILIPAAFICQLFTIGFTFIKGLFTSVKIKNIKSNADRLDIICRKLDI